MINKKEDCRTCTHTANLGRYEGICAHCGNGKYSNYEKCTKDQKNEIQK